MLNQKKPKPLETEHTYTIKDEDWKFCAIVDLGIAGEVDKILSFENHAVRIFRPNDLNISHGHIVEVYSPKEYYQDLHSAFIKSNEILQRFLNRVSFMTYQDHNRVKPISVSSYKVNLNEEFEMLLTVDLSHDIPRPNMKAEDFDQIAKGFENNEINHALHEMRLALKSDSIFEKILHYYNVIEQVASLNTTEKAKRKCPACAVVYELDHKATGNTMRDTFAGQGFSGKDFKNIRKIRSKIAHGASKNLISENEEFHDYLSMVEKVAANTLSQVTGISIFAAKFPRIIKQTCIIKGMKLQTNSGDTSFLRKVAIKLGLPWGVKNTIGPAAYNILDLRFEFLTKTIGLDDQGNQDLSWKPMAGPIGGTPDIFPYAWPY